MKVDRKLFRGLGTVATVVALIVLSAAVASAFTLRSPQKPVLGGTLQGYLNSQGEAINVLTDQVDAQVWNTSVSGNSSFTLMIELGGNAAANGIGVYNAGSPLPLFQVFPGAATNGWFASAHFGSGNLVVTLFDQNSIIQGQNFYPGVNANGFGFYLSGPGGTFYSQDALNPGGNAQILTYLGTGQNFGDWWECFEDLAIAGGGSDQDFDDAVLLIQSVTPTAVDGHTWGKIKSLYRK